ncbi:RNA-directed DNA polymerase (reverse transcriptase)-related family protein [Rhynchospora pubera]|uniref:RNA-directed DNA polymerase (Reverse transcriptase)-related family protein n=1 Tax=Rhynchospora pubera TaxID=906938 RepID=A0AAV8HGI0_9POAL|nr:RNA-directed DNA polymerase (reverse transcriptase)-related family protein [Rhynchospora pubera]
MSSVLFNGIQGDYFLCKRGVRQGDPLSPYLFILATDTLSKLITKGINSGHIQGLGPSLDNGKKIVHLQYADDTLLFLKADNIMVDKLQWILKSFESLSGLKINFAKSELLSLTLSTNICEELASMLNYKIGHFLLKYLGLPLHWKAPSRSDWRLVIDKVGQKLTSWKGNLMSLGGRLVMVNSVLTAVPLYFLSFFKAPNWVIQKIDKIRRDFLWGSTGFQEKVPLVSWSVICRPKDLGGWEVLNLHLMNKAHLGKCAKYKHRLKSGLSPFWKEVKDNLHLIRLVSNKVVNSGDNTEFWLDTWHDNCSLAIKFLLLFSKTKRQQVSVSKVWNHGNIKLRLRRGVSSALRAEKEQLLEILNNSNFNLLQDSIVWNWEKSNLFSVKSFYRFLSSRGVTLELNKTVWPLKIPLKIKCFVWMLVHYKLLTKDRLVHRGRSDIDTSCVFCDATESIDHLFSHCSFIRIFWVLFSRYNKWGFHTNSLSIWDIWTDIIALPTNNRVLMQILFAAFSWVIWKERNSRIFTDNVGLNASFLCSSIFSLFFFWTSHPTGMEQDFHRASTGADATGGSGT